jgi:hypothetical protein
MNVTVQPIGLPQSMGVQSVTASSVDISATFAGSVAYVRAIGY